MAKAINYEKLQRDTINIEVRDASGLTVTKTFAIGVSDILEAITGTSASETLKGGIGVDKVLGGSGNDGLYGFAAKDQLFGDAGNDTLNGGSRADRLDGGRLGYGLIRWCDGGRDGKHLGFSDLGAARRHFLAAS